jgi:hypothetical protein
MKQSHPKDSHIPILNMNLFEILIMTSNPKTLDISEINY